ncbi:MAG TPA: VOC family protein [Terriglobales bacterium]|nr:VOC family protein [Terriglobales bacterium]
MKSMAVAPYLFFNGNCEQALHFYQQALGAKLGAIHRFSDAPPNAGPGGQPMCPPESMNQIMNAEFTIGTSTLYASDCPPGRYQPPQGISLTISVTTADEVQQIFAALSQGGKVNMPPSETFFAQNFGMLTDKFGIAWMVIAPKAV